MLLLDELQETHPDCWYAGSRGNSFILNQLRQALGIHKRTREDLFCTDKGCRMWHTPGVGVKHRHDRHHYIPLGKAGSLCHADHHRMQEKTTMTIDCPLGITSRPRGIAHRSSGVLLE